jgi:hypothetical protein
MIVFLPVFLVIAAYCAAAQNPATRDYSKESWVTEKLSTTFVFEADGTGWREDSAAVRVQSAEAVRQFGVISLGYDAGAEKVEQFAIRVRKPDGTVVVTPDTDVRDVPSAVSQAAPMYSDIRLKQAPVKALGIGDTVEYRARKALIKAGFPGQFWQHLSIGKQGVILEET